jgi:site-specific DNA-cytosine methylase
MTGLPVATEEHCEWCSYQPCDCWDPNAPVPEPQGLELDGPALVDYLDSLTAAERTELAGPYPVRWLYPWREGEPKRGINVCGGCGGGCAGLRLVLGVEMDLICIDSSKDATETARAAGCNAILFDVRQIDPRHPALRWTSYAVYTMPCPDYSPAGKREGLRPENIRVLCRVMEDVAEAFGNVWRSGGAHGDSSTATFGRDSCISIEEMWGWLSDDGMGGTTAGLMLAPVLISIGLLRNGAPLEGIIIEQAWTLPEEIRVAIGMELIVAGWPGVLWDVLDAGEFGSPSTRKRAIMAALRDKTVDTIEAPGVTTLASDAIGWDPETWINTRGIRRTPGGNEFRLGRTVPGVTSKIRGWYAAHDPDHRFTIAEVCLLVGLPPDFPVVGSRTSQCQQLGDIFSPLVAAAVWGILLGIEWRPFLLRYLAERYPNVHAYDERLSLAA